MTEEAKNKKRRTRKKKEVRKRKRKKIKVHSTTVSPRRDLSSNRSVS